MQDKNIRDAGLKVTLPRVKILGILEQGDRCHLSAEDVHQKLKNAGEVVGLATVYRVLTQFEAAGLVKRHHFASGYSVFELESGEHHDHLVCIKCHRVEEFVDLTIERHQDEIARQAGFQITDHHLTIYGICADCSSES